MVKKQREDSGRASKYEGKVSKERTLVYYRGRKRGSRVAISRRRRVGYNDRGPSAGDTSDAGCAVAV